MSKAEEAVRFLNSIYGDKLKFMEHKCSSGETRWYAPLGNLSLNNILANARGAGYGLFVRYSCVRLPEEGEGSEYIEGDFVEVSEKAVRYLDKNQEEYFFPPYDEMDVNATKELVEEIIRDYLGYILVEEMDKKEEDVSVFASKHLKFSWEENKDYSDGTLIAMFSFKDKKDYNKFKEAWFHAFNYRSSVADVVGLNTEDTLPLLFDHDEDIVDAETGNWLCAAGFNLKGMKPRKPSTRTGIVDLSSLKVGTPLVDSVAFAKQFLLDVSDLTKKVKMDVFSYESGIMVSFDSGFDVGEFLFKFFRETESGRKLMKYADQNIFSDDYWNFHKYSGKFAELEACCDFDSYSYEDVMDDAGINGFEFVYWSDKEGYSLKYDLFRSEDEDEDVLN